MPKKSRSQGPKYTVTQHRGGVHSEQDAKDVVGVKAIIGGLMAEVWESGGNFLNITIIKNR